MGRLEKKDAEGETERGSEGSEKEINPLWFNSHGIWELLLATDSFYIDDLWFNRMEWMSLMYAPNKATENHPIDMIWYDVAPRVAQAERNAKGSACFVM